MNVPASGLILIPPTLALLVVAPSRLSEWALFVTIFQGAAIVNVGSGFAVGVSPYFFVASLVALRVVPQWWSRRIRFFRGEPALRHMQVLAVFVGWTVFSSFASPVLFAGTPVDNPRKGVDQSFFFQTPLHWSFSNAGQAAYMVLNFIMLLHMLQMSKDPGYSKRLQWTYSLSGICVVAIGAYQVLCGSLGLHFPSWLFNSNTAWGQSYNQWFSGISRLSATFVEPSDAATFLSAWSLFELTLVIGGVENSLRHWSCVVAGTIALVETASTTGYVTVAVMWSVISLTTAKTVLTRGRLNLRAMLALTVMAVGAIVALAAMPSARLVLNGVLFGKASSASGVHRVATLGRAVDVFYDTLTLGAGLGSNRAMSLGFYVLSNLGLPGVVLLSCLLLQLCSQCLQLARSRSNRATRGFVQAAGAAYVANFLAMLFSGAEVTTPRLWMLWAMLAVGLRQAWFFETTDRRIIDLGEESIVVPGEKRAQIYNWPVSASNRQAPNKYEGELN
jgi:hypothetical protein